MTTIKVDALLEAAGFLLERSLVRLGTMPGGCASGAFGGGGSRGLRLGERALVLATQAEAAAQAKATATASAKGASSSAARLLQAAVATPPRTLTRSLLLAIHLKVVDRHRSSWHVIA